MNCTCRQAINQSITKSKTYCFRSYAVAPPKLSRSAIHRQTTQLTTIDKSGNPSKFLGSGSVCFSRERRCFTNSQTSLPSHSTLHSRIYHSQQRNVMTLSFEHRSMKSLTWKSLRVVILRIFRRVVQIFVSVVSRVRNLNWCIPLTPPGPRCHDWSSPSLKRISRRMEAFGFQRLSCLIWVGLR